MGKLLTSKWAGLDDRLAPAAEWLYSAAQRAGWSPVITSVSRSEVKQLYLYLTQSQACPPGHSAHEVGLAFDMVVSFGKNSPQQAYLGAVWKYIGGAWDPKDPVHFTIGKVGCF